MIWCRTSCTVCWAEQILCQLLGLHPAEGSSDQLTLLCMTGVMHAGLVQCLVASCMRPYLEPYGAAGPCSLLPDGHSCATQGWGGRNWCRAASTACRAGGATSCAPGASCASSTWRRATAPTPSSAWAAMTARHAPSDHALSKPQHRGSETCRQALRVPNSYTQCGLESGSGGLQTLSLRMPKTTHRSCRSVQTLPRGRHKSGNL